MKSAQWSEQSGSDQQVNQYLPGCAREADLEWEIRHFYNWVFFQFLCANSLNLIVSYIFCLVSCLLKDSFT